MVTPAIRPKLILVFGATGKQGGAVARHLLDRGFAVRALVRDLNKPAAQALARRGAELVRGDMDDRSSLDAAMAGCSGVFSVQNFWETGVEREIRQGMAVADAADAAKVQHLVYSSVGSAHRQTNLSHFESKWHIEEYIRRLGLPHTILRPVFFMDNWGIRARDYILGGILPQPLDPDKPLQQIATDDIGAFAAMAFADPDHWLGRAIDLAGDELTMPQTAEVFARVLGRPVEYMQIPWEMFEETVGEDRTRMYQWFNRAGYEANIPMLRREYPPLKTLEQFLQTEEWVRREVRAGV